MIGEGPVTPADDLGNPDVLATAASGTPIDPGALLRRAWSVFSAAWPACLVVYWGAVAAWWLIVNLLVIVLAGLNVAIGDPSVTPLLEFARFAGLVLVPAWLWLGRGIAFLKIARRQPVAQDDLFRGGPYLLTALLAILGVVAVAAVPSLVAAGSIQGLLAIGGGDWLVATARRVLPVPTPELVAEFEGELMVVTGLIVALLALSYASFFAVRVRLRPFALLILDRRAGVVESLRTSVRLTRGRAATLLVVHLAQLTINAAGLMLCCLGLFATLPLTSLVSAVTYDALAADLPPVEIPEEEFDDLDGA